MTLEKDTFGASGPVHLKLANWNCEHYRRSVAASLVQGVYVLERDRQFNRQFPNSLAAPWWEFFHFDLIRKLVDDVDHSIFGAIFEYNPPSSRDSSAENAPRFVVAFRGTVTDKETISRDIRLDLLVIQNGLHTTSRFAIAMQAVKHVTSSFRNSSVWLSGHSLGAAMAVLVGKNMVRSGLFLDTFLFNPPFVGAPTEAIQDKNVKQGIRIARSLFTAGLAVALKARSGTEEDPFGMLSSWTPHIFVHPGDHLCSEYIGYFEHRKHMEELGAGSIERLATQNSISDIILRRMGRESEPLHLLPSANLVVNTTPCLDFKTAHGIHQWWRDGLTLQSSSYRYTI